MILKQVWEYQIYADYWNEKHDGVECKTFHIVTEVSPVTGWREVFEALSARGDLSRLHKIQSASCYQKELLF